MARRLSLGLLLFAFAALLPSTISAQAMTEITATSVNAGGNVVTGYACLSAVDMYGNPIAISRAGGGFYKAESPFCAKLAAGVLATLEVPNPLTDSAPGHGYALTIYDSSSGTTTDPINIYQIGGASWSLDNFAPSVSVPTANAFTFTTGSGSHPVSCTAPAFDVRVNNGLADMAVCTAGAFVEAGNGVVVTASQIQALGTLSNSITGSAASAGTAALATKWDHTPAVCSAGYAATGTDASGNATGCFSPSAGNGTFAGGTVANPTTFQSSVTLAADPTANLQAATKQYVDNHAGATFNGGTVTSPITLPGNPATALQAAPKQYVDAVASHVGNQEVACGNGSSVTDCGLNVQANGPRLILNPGTNSNLLDLDLSGWESVDLPAGETLAPQVGDDAGATLASSEYSTAPRPTMAAWLQAFHSCTLTPVRIGIYGDSRAIADQTNTNSSTWNVSEANRWANKVLAFLLAAGCPSHGTGLVPVIWAIGNNTPNADNWTLTSGSIANDGTTGPSQSGTTYSGSGSALMTAGTVLTFASPYPYDHIDTYCAAGPGYASITVAVDGTTVGTCGGSSATATATVQISSAFSSSTHTATFTCASGGNPCEIYGADGTNGTAGVSIDNVAIASGTAEMYGTTPAVQMAYSDLIPDGENLAIYAAISNEVQNGVSTTTFGNSLTAIVNHLRARTIAPSVLLVSLGQNGTPGQAPYYPIIAATASALNTGFIDFRDRFGATQNLSLFNYPGSTDTAHENATGNAEEAAMILATVIDNAAVNASIASSGASTCAHTISSGNYTALTTDCEIYMNGGTLTLPAASPGELYFIVNYSASSSLSVSATPADGGSTGTGNSFTVAPQSGVFVMTAGSGTYWIIGTSNASGSSSSGSFSAIYDSTAGDSYTALTTDTEIYMTAGTVALPTTAQGKIYFIANVSTTTRTTITTPSGGAASGFLVPIEGGATVVSNGSGVYQIVGVYGYESIIGTSPYTANQSDGTIFLSGGSLSLPSLQPGSTVRVVNISSSTVVSVSDTAAAGTANGYSIAAQHAATFTTAGSGTWWIASVY